MDYSYYTNEQLFNAHYVCKNMVLQCRLLDNSDYFKWKEKKLTIEKEIKKRGLRHEK